MIFVEADRVGLPRGSTVLRKEGSSLFYSLPCWFKAVSAAALRDMEVAYVGSKKAETKKHAMDNLEVDDEKLLHPKSKKDKARKNHVVLQNPVLRESQQLSAGPGKEEGSEAMAAGAAGNKRRKKVATARLSKEYVAHLVEHPPLPPFQLFPSMDLEFMEMQRKFVATQRAEREERDRVFKQY